MNDKITIGEVTVQEFNLIMKQLATGQLGECLDLFMKFSKLGQDFHAAQQNGATPNFSQAQQIQ